MQSGMRTSVSWFNSKPPRQKFSQSVKEIFPIPSYVNMETKGQKFTSNPRAKTATTMMESMAKFAQGTLPPRSHDELSESAGAAPPQTISPRYAPPLRSTNKPGKLFG